MLSRYLNPDLTLDLDAVDADARKTADGRMARPGAAARSTWQTEFDEAHARYLDLAQGYRSHELWRIERAAEEVARAALPARERRILELREMAHLAPMIDCTAEAIAVQDRAERELATLMAEAV